MFGKEHKNVLQAIYALDCSQSFNELNFQPVNYQDNKGEARCVTHLRNFFASGLLLLIISV